MSTKHNSKQQQKSTGETKHKNVDAFIEASKNPSEPLNDFVWTLAEEPHASRRRAIIAAHPEVRELFGHEWKTKYMMTGIVVFQVLSGIALRNHVTSWWFWLYAYVFGATATQALFLGIHETSHFLSFKTFWHNKVFNLFANIPAVFPYSAAFIMYHTEHHKYLGVEGMDVDLPSHVEAVLFRNAFTKTVYLSLFVLAYAIRPVLVRPLAFNQWQLANLCVQAVSNALLVLFFGWGPIVYLLASVILACSLHPCASHFLAEHLAVLGNHETYSYYGPLNYLTFNVGYHNEHHDFPNVAWSKLPRLREIAHKFYDELPQHNSWPLVMWKFITDPSITPHNRVVRADVTGASRWSCGDVKARKWE